MMVVREGRENMRNSKTLCCHSSKRDLINNKRRLLVSGHFWFSEKREGIAIL